MDKIVYNFEDAAERLKEVEGRWGLWGFARNHHAGHDACLELTRANSDYIVGIYWRNTSYISEALLGYTFLPRAGAIPDDVDYLVKNTDLVIIMNEEYIPWRKYYTDEQMLKRLRKQLPDWCLPQPIVQDPLWYEELRGGMANKTMINEIIGPHYHCGGSKDCWRYYYVHWWHNIVFRKSTYDLVRPVKDATGNDISNSRSYSGLEINKPLLKKGLRSREDVNFYNRDLSGLNCVSFFWRPETKSQHARFWLRRDKENKTFTWFNESFFEEER